MRVPASRWSREFVVPAYDCLLMKLDNHVFRDFLIRQMPEICQQPMDSNIHRIVINFRVANEAIYSDRHYCNNKKPVDIKYFLQKYHNALTF